jgi:hypothetical protein
VEHWFHGDGRPDADMQADARLLGVILPEVKPVQFVVWPENVAAVQLFIDCQTQWRTTGAGVIGLDYSVVLAVATLSGSSDPLGLLRDIQVMETRAVELINAEAKEAAKA